MTQLSSEVFSSNTTHAVHYVTRSCCRHTVVSRGRYGHARSLMAYLTFIFVESHIWTSSPIISSSAEAATQ